MSPRELTINVDGGHLAALDHGGPPPGAGSATSQVLLVHSSGHNAAVWNEVAATLTSHAHIVAVDLRGHGHSSASSSNAEQYWRDLATITSTLGWTHPVLVGHSSGGYAVTAATAAGLVDPAALCLIDGFVLDERDSAAQAQAAMSTPQALRQLQDTFGYGWRGDREEADAAVERAVAHRDQDWLNAGASAALVRAVTERSFTPASDVQALWARRPSLDEVATVAAVDLNADVFPSIDVYDHLTCPIVAVLPAEGLYASRRQELAEVLHADPQRTLVDVGGGHNTVMAAPGTVSDIINELVRS